jgi:hypothetical protein
LTAVPGALCTSSASSVNNKESQSEHEPTMTAGKQTESYPINSSSTIATIVDKPGHNEASDDDADVGDGPLATGDHEMLDHIPCNPPNN